MNANLPPAMEIDEITTDGTSIGDLLRASRNRRNEELRQVSDELRIRQVYLEAIENNKFEELPGAIYAIGFIRTYAEHLGLDGEEVVRRYKSEAISPESKQDLTFPSLVPEHGIPGGAIVMLGLVLAAIGYGSWYYVSTKNIFVTEQVPPVPEKLAAIVGEKPVATEPVKTAEEPTSAANASPVDSSGENSSDKPEETVAEKPAEKSPDTSVESGQNVKTEEVVKDAAQPVEKIAETVRRVSPDTLIGVDAITALGVYDIQPAGWDIDAVITGSQKALMLPPGLAFVWLSERAWAAAEVSKSPRYYFDLRIERKSQAKNTTAWTPAISLVAGLKVAFDMMQKEGLENIFGRHARLAEGTRAAFLALGLEIFPKDLLSESVSAVSVPEGIDGKAVPNLMQGEQGITIAGGQGHLSGKIFRIGHMGYVDESDVLTAIGGLEMVLAGLGHRLTKGAGLAAAQEVFSK